jgi:hypothetical protein
MTSFIIDADSHEGFLQPCPACHSYNIRGTFVMQPPRGELHCFDCGFKLSADNFVAVFVQWNNAMVLQETEDNE